MKDSNLLLVLLFTYVQFGFTQINVNTYAEQTASGYLIYADNDEYCPISIRVDFELNNLVSSTGNHKIYILPEKQYKILLTELKFIKNDKYSFRYKTRYNYGSYLSNDFDLDYIYYLPFKKGESFVLSQGYNGKLSHSNENSLDFSMPIGSSVLAAREGVVIQVIDNNTVTCEDFSCEKYNNKILIYHSDGTFATYEHISENGALVSVGEKVEKGQLIAKSGNIGFSTGPHLHFTVFEQKLGSRVTIPTKFKINSDNKIDYLIEKVSYLKDY